MEYPNTEGYVPINNAKSDSFLQWFLSLQKSITDLKLLWRGWERNEYEQWVKRPDGDLYRIMNELGIHWAVSIMLSYLNKISQATNWDENHMNYEMRKAYRVVWFGLAVKYKDFSLDKSNTSLVARQILFQIHSMLLSARGEGIRKFISTTQSVSEHRILNENQRPGFGQAVKGLFGGRQDG